MKTTLLILPLLLLAACGPVHITVDSKPTSPVGFAMPSELPHVPTDPTPAPHIVTTTPDLEQAAKVQAQFLYMENKAAGNGMTLREIAAATPLSVPTTPNPQQAPVTQWPSNSNSRLSLDRGAYNQRKHVASAPILRRVVRQK